MEDSPKMFRDFAVELYIYYFFNMFGKAFSRSVYVKSAECRVSCQVSNLLEKPLLELQDSA